MKLITIFFILIGAFNAQAAGATCDIYSAKLKDSGQSITIRQELSMWEDSVGFSNKRISMYNVKASLWVLTILGMGGDAEATIDQECQQILNEGSAEDVVCGHEVIELGYVGACQ